MIFYLSSSQGSLEQTSRFIRPILLFIFPHSSPEDISLYHGVIRKAAHVFVYAVLGLLSVRAIERRSASAAPKIVLISLLLVLLIAALDETNQSFSSTRSGSLWDVGLDLLGGSMAIVAALLLRQAGRFLRKTKRTNDESLDEK